MCIIYSGSFGELGNKERYFHVEPLDPMETGVSPHYGNCIYVYL